MMNENYMAMTEGLKTFLERLELTQYYDKFIIKGFDQETDLCYMNSEDLDSMLITDERHRKMIIAAAAKHTLSTEHRLYEWLRANGLDYYFINFVQSELIEMDDIRLLNLPDDRIYDDLEIILPGHKRRLERAVSKLRKKQRTSSEAEPPVAVGHWTKPSALQDAKYDFLCIDAKISATNCPENSKSIEFMVDSGSDVVTIREETLQELNLELIGPIQSRGVHASKRKNLYKANLSLGTEDLEIEVMAECYDSIGSRVIRHFRHFIDGTRHIWLKGNYKDPSMTPHASPACSSPQPSNSGEITS